METVEQQQLPVIPTTQRIVAEGNAQGVWKAWFEDQPENVHTGEFPILAVDTLLKATPERVPEYYSVRIDESAKAEHYVEFKLTYWTDGRRELP